MALAASRFGIPVDELAARRVLRKVAVAEEISEPVSDIACGALAEVLTELAGPDPIPTERLHELRGRVRGLLDLSVECSRALARRREA